MNSGKNLLLKQQNKLSMVMHQWSSATRLLIIPSFNSVCNLTSAVLPPGDQLPRESGRLLQMSHCSETWHTSGIHGIYSGLNPTGQAAGHRSLSCAWQDKGRRIQCRKNCGLVPSKLNNLIKLDRNVLNFKNSCWFWSQCILLLETLVLFLVLWLICTCSQEKQIKGTRVNV